MMSSKERPVGYIIYLVHAPVLIPAEIGHNVLKGWPLLRLLMPASLHQRGVALGHVLGYSGAVACDDLKEHLHGEGLLTGLMKVTRQLQSSGLKTKNTSASHCMPQRQQAPN